MLSGFAPAPAEIFLMGQLLGPALSGPGCLEVQPAGAFLITGGVLLRQPVCDG